MKRMDIRNLKRSARAQNDSEAMRVLLERSVQFGHKRLALIRCMQFEQMGGQVSHEILCYCQSVAGGMRREELEKLMRQAADASVGRFCDKNPLT